MQGSAEVEPRRRSATKPTRAAFRIGQENLKADHVIKAHQIGVTDFKDRSEGRLSLSQQCGPCGTASCVLRALGVVYEGQS